MAKNILLIFLSDVKAALDDDGNVIVRETRYENISGEPTRTTNESAVRYLLQGGTALDKIFIFASKTVRENHIASGGKKFIGADGKPKTHLEYFSARLGNIPAEIYNYDENQSGSDNLKSVAEIAARIQNFASDSDVTLHVDLTGGMRHINMMMLDVIRLLEYSGIAIGKIIYSNFASRRVEEISSIYDLFQLIAGVEEFVRFGSVKALKDYYCGKTLSPALENLLDAMENFADEIKLCHYGQLKNSIIRLHDAVCDFAATDDVQDILMARLIGRIRRDYQSLIELRDLDDLRVIRWCVDNGYMQQALTLYTERVPEYLCDKNFLTVSADEKSKIQKYLATDNRNFGFYLLNNYLETDENFNTIAGKLGSGLDELHKTYFRLIKEVAFLDIRKSRFDYDSWRQQLLELLDKSCDKFQIMRGDILCEDENLLRAQFELLVELRENSEPLLNLDAPVFKPFAKFLAYDDGKFRAELENIPQASARYKNFIELMRKSSKDVAKNFLPNLKCAKVPQTYRLLEMIRAGIFTPAVPVETFLSIMNKYFRLKDERNHSNHARADSGEFPTAEALKIFIEAGLNEIEGAQNDFR